MARHPKVHVAMAVNRSADSCLMTALWLIPLFPIVLLVGLVRFGALYIAEHTQKPRRAPVGAGGHRFPNGLSSDPECTSCGMPMSRFLQYAGGGECKSFRHIATKFFYRLFRIR